MSWWISLQDKDGKNIDTDEVRSEGGTYRLGGQSEAELNVTYNYSQHFDFKKLDGLSAVEAEKILLDAIGRLGNDADEDYWKPTEGNAKRAIQALLDFAHYAIKNKIECSFNVD